MTVNYTSLLGLGQPVTGTESGTWGDDVNNAITAYLDIAVAGTQTLSTDADVTLSLTQGTSTATNIGSTTAQYAILNCTGSRSVLRNINVPNSSKTYIVLNQTTGGFAVRIRGTTGPTTGVTIANGRYAVVAWGGSDFVVVATNDITALSGTLAVGNGGTGAATLTGLVIGNGTSAFTTVTAPSGDVVGTTDTQTLTNKRINPRVVAAAATSGNLTINGDTTDLYKAEGLTGAITFLTPSGTPVDGQKLIIRLEDNGTARGITWTTSSGAFRAVGITLPTTTTLSKTTYVGCIYNSTDVFWDAIATVTQA